MNQTTICVWRISVANESWVEVNDRREYEERLWIMPARWWKEIDFSIAQCQYEWSNLAFDELYISLQLSLISMEHSRRMNATATVTVNSSPNFLSSLPLP